jgi:hypothetical protein
MDWGEPPQDFCEHVNKLSVLQKQRNFLARWSTFRKRFCIALSYESFGMEVCNGTHNRRALKPNYVQDN